jgi:hypothetical protein
MAKAIRAASPKRLGSRTALATATIRAMPFRVPDSLGHRSGSQQSGLKLPAGHRLAQLNLMCSLSGDNA